MNIEEVLRPAQFLNNEASCYVYFICKSRTYIKTQSAALDKTVINLMLALSKSLSHLHCCFLIINTQFGQGWQTTVSNNYFETYYYKIQATKTSGRHIGTCGEWYKLSCFPSSIPKSSLFFESQLTPNGFVTYLDEVLPNCP